MHSSRRAEFHRRWSHSRALLALGCLAIPTLLLAALPVGMMLLPEWRDRPTGVDAAALLVSAMSLGVVLWYLRPTKMLERTEFWGLRTALCCAVQVVALEWSLPPTAGPALSRGVPLAGLALALLAGVLTAVARAKLFAPGGSALAATSLPLRHAIFLPQAARRGEVVITADQLFWYLQQGANGIGWMRLAREENQIPLDEIVDVSVTEVRDPYRAPPVLVMEDGTPLPPPTGEVVHVRTRQGEVLLPAVAAEQLAQQLRERLRTPPPRETAPLDG
ncbi:MULTISPECIES: hypothetical protein [unclassified Actinopolyspora]|uniref:hypothetical protein n=1 Tax=unclassified Actinopolyspora TaxID=2639451 RepID=UPI0013F610CA|nr:MULTISPECIES: hypothetical protein [unclassified Actinopolyspora]NHD18901.1 hypothetical protein [Actinopolyspora sp. BKK2]NHE77324.1 hypothetical protein [Actinopolyspora sp. BKK1]